MDNELQEITATEFFKLLNNDLIEQAYQYITENKLNLKPSTKFSVLIKDEPFPPKDFLRIAAKLKSYKIEEKGFNGGKANVPFEKLNYEIIGNNEYPFFNGSLLYPQVKKYQNAIDNTDWLVIDECYKFHFLKWTEENIDFENDANQEIQDKIFESQEKIYGPESNNKGVNFIQSIKRHHDDYLTLDDIEKLKNIILKSAPANKENLTLSFNSFPKSSAFLCLFAPTKFMAYDGESIPAFEFLSKGSKNIKAPKRNYKAFRFYQIFYKNIKKHLKESHLDTTAFKQLMNVEELTELHWNFITQDFLLFITRRIMTKNLKTINVTGSKVYKCSMGVFLKHTDFKHIDPIKVFEDNNVVVIHQNTSKNQGAYFKENLNKGDYVYVTYGQQRLSYFAKVVGDAKPVNKLIDIELDSNWIGRKVEVLQLPKINNTQKLSSDKRGWMPSGNTTFKQVRNLTEANSALFNKFYNLELIDENNNSNMIPTKKNNKQPLNQILYGPPGTGKTYKTKKIAVEIIEGITYSDSKEDRAIILEKYEDYVASENIHFTTFHQSMSYEDFIEGIKPETTDNQVTYDVQDGIFKEICDEARVKQESNFDEAYQSLLLEINENPNDYIVLHTPTGKEFRINVNSNNNLNLYTSKEIKKQGTVTKEKLLKQINGFEVFNGWEGYVNGIVDYLKSKHHLVTSFKEEKKQNYVLIIDEINRGNVSSIFGELITLIETDKRAEQDEAISVTLPYSKSNFSVPNNVFIIGTMNTADRSVEALDTALRRRFSFEEILPKPGLLTDLNYKEVDLSKMLNTINQRIELLIDKDHQIGHSYFFNVTSLEDLILVFKDKIIPLLEEYFYGDFGKIGLVLGDNFVVKQTTNNKSILAKFDDYTEIDFVTDKSIFRLKKPIVDMQVSDFTSIYQ